MRQVKSGFAQIAAQTVRGAPVTHSIAQGVRLRGRVRGRALQPMTKPRTTGGRRGEGHHAGQSKREYPTTTT
jgi:hypothetical protein